MTTLSDSDMMVTRLAPTTLSALSSELEAALREAEETGHALEIDLSAFAGQTVSLPERLVLRVPVSFVNSGAAPVVLAGGDWLVLAAVQVQNVVPPMAYVGAGGALSGDGVNEETTHRLLIVRTQADITANMFETTAVASLRMADKMLFDGFTGYWPAQNDESNNYVFDYGVEVGEGGISINNGFSGRVYHFEGSLSGSGDITFNWVRVASTTRWMFAGDVSGYTGSIVFPGSPGYPLALTFTGSSDINLGIDVAKSGSSLTIGGARTVNSHINMPGGTMTVAAGAEVTLTGEVTLSSLAVNGELCMSETAEVTTAGVSIAAGVAMTVQEGAVMTVTNTLTNNGSLRVEGMLEAAAVSGGGTLEFGENSVLVYSLSSVSGAESELRRMLAAAEGLGAHNVLIDVTALAGQTLTLSEPLILPLGVELRNEAAADIHLSGELSAPQGVALMGDWNTEELQLRGGSLKRMVRLTSAESFENDLRAALQQAEQEGVSALVLEVSALAGQTVELCEALHLPMAAEFRNTATETVRLTGAALSTGAALTLSKGVEQDCLRGNYVGREQVSYVTGSACTYTPDESARPELTGGDSVLWLTDNHLVGALSAPSAEGVSHIVISRNELNAPGDAALSGMMEAAGSGISIVGKAQGRAYVDMADNAAKTAGTGERSVAAGVFAGNVEMRSLEHLNISRNEAVAASTDSFAEACGGAFGGGADSRVTFRDIRSVEIIGNRAEGSGLPAGDGHVSSRARGGALGTDVVFEDIDSLLIAGNSAVAQDVAGGAICGNVQIRNVGRTIFRGNFTVRPGETEERTLNSVSAAYVQLTLRAGQRVEVYDAMDVSGTLTLDGEQGATLLFSAAEAGETARFSPSYAAALQINGGTLAVADGAVLNGREMTLAAGAELRISADAAVSLSGNLSGEGSVIIDFSKAGDGLYQNILSYGSLSGSGIEVRAAGLTEGAVCVFYRESNGISAYLNSKILEVSSAEAAGPGSLAEALAAAAEMEVTDEFPVYIYLDALAGKTLDTAALAPVAAPVVLVNRSGERVVFSQSLNLTRAATLRGVTLGTGVTADTALTLDAAIVQGNVELAPGGKLSILSEHGATVVEGDIINHGTVMLDGMLHLKGDLVSDDGTVEYGEHYGRIVELKDAATAEADMKRYLADDNIRQLVFDVTALAGQSIELHEATVWKTPAQLINKGSAPVLFTGGYWETYVPLVLEGVEAPATVPLGGGSLSGGNAAALSAHKRIDVALQMNIGSGFMTEEVAAMSGADELVFNGFVGHLPGTDVSMGTYRGAYHGTLVIADKGAVISNVASYSNYSFDGAFRGTGTLEMAPSGTTYDSSVWNISADMSCFYGSICVDDTTMNRTLRLTGNSDIHARTIRFAASGQTLSLGGRRTVSTDLMMAASRLTLAENSALVLDGAVQAAEVAVAAGASVCVGGVQSLGSLSLESGSSYTVREGGALNMHAGVVSGAGSLVLESGAELNLQGGRLSVPSLTVKAGAKATLSGCSLANTALVLSCEAEIHLNGLDLSHTSLVLTDVSAGTRIDLSGNYWGDNVEWEDVFNRLGDEVAPYVLIRDLPGAEFRVTSVSPAKYLSAASDALSVRFSQKLKAESVTADNTYLRAEDGSVIRFTSVSVNEKELLLGFEPLPAGGLYTLVIGSEVQSRYGLPIAGIDETEQAYLVNLTADVTPETVLAVLPEKAVNPAYVDVLFSGAIDVATVNRRGVSLRSAGGSTATLGAITMVAPDTLRIAVSSFPEIGAYTLSLPAGMADAAGNAVQLPSEALLVNVQSPDVAVRIEEPVNAIVSPNGSLRPHITLTNHGNAAAEGLRAELWLTANGSITTSSVCLAVSSAELAGAAPGAQVTWAPDVQFSTLSSTVPDGAYTLVVRVAAANEMAAYAGNNTASIGSLTVEFPKLSLAVTDSRAVEGGEALTYTVSRTGSCETALEVQLLSPLAQRLGLPASVIIAAGESSAAFTATVLNDDVYTGDAAAQVTAAAEGYRTASAVDMTIVEDELPSLTLSLSATEMKEGSSTRVAYTITRQGSTAQALTVHLACEQAALLGLPETLTFAEGRDSVRYRSAIVDNSVFQGTQDVRITVSAEGYLSSAAVLRVLDDELPSLSLSLQNATLAEGEKTICTLTSNHVSDTDTIVKLGCAETGQLLFPATVTLRAGENSVSFELVAVQDKTAEIDKHLSIVAKADGYNTASAELTLVDDDLPAVSLELNRTIVSEQDGYYAIQAQLKRTGNTTDSISVQLEDRDGIGLILPASITMAPNVDTVNFTIGVADDAVVNGTRSGVVSGVVVLNDCGCSASASVNGGVFLSEPITVTDNDGPTISLNLNRSVLREDGTESAQLTVSVNFVATTDLTVSLSEMSGSLSLPDTVTIPAGQSSVALTVTPVSDGVNTGNKLARIEATAEGCEAGNAYLQITDVDLPDLVVQGLEIPDSLLAGHSMPLTLTIKNQGYAATAKDFDVHLFLSDGTDLGTYTITDRLAAGASTERLLHVNMPEITGIYALTALVDSGTAVQELEETNNHFRREQVRIHSGIRVNAEVAEDALYQTGLVHINGQISADTPDISLSGQKVNIYVSSTYGVMQILTAETDEQGHFHAEYEASDNVVGTYSISAGVMSERSGTLDTFRMAGMKTNLNNGRLVCDMLRQETKEGSFTVTNSGDVDLTQVQVECLDVPDNMQLVLSGFDDVLKAGESMTVHYSLIGNELTEGDAYQHLQFLISSQEGCRTTAEAYVYISPRAGQLSLSTSRVTERISVGKGGRYIDIELCNTSDTPTGKIALDVGDVPWLSVFSGTEIDSLAAGESTTITLWVDDAKEPDLALNYDYAGSLILTAENAESTRLNYSFRFVDTETATYRVQLYDNYSLYADSNKVVAGAKAKLINAYDHRDVYTGMVDENGLCVFEDVLAGCYYLEVTADGCDTSRLTVLLQPGADVRDALQLNNRAVTWAWDVERKQYVETYTVTQTVDFVTQVPAVRLETSGPIELSNLAWGESEIVQYTVMNKGLIAATDYSFSLPSVENVYFEILNPTTEIKAQSQYTFSILVRYGDAESAGDDMQNAPKSSVSDIYNGIMCFLGQGVHFWLECVNSKYYSLQFEKVSTRESNCAAITPGPGIVVPGDPKPQVPPIVPPVPPEKPPVRPKPGIRPVKPVGPYIPVQMSETSCSPCAAAIINTLMECTGINTVTTGDVLLIVGSGGVAWVKSKLTKSNILGNSTACLKGVMDILRRCEIPILSPEAMDFVDDFADGADPWVKLAADLIDLKNLPDDFPQKKHDYTLTDRGTIIDHFGYDPGEIVSFAGNAIVTVNDTICDASEAQESRKKSGGVLITPERNTNAEWLNQAAILTLETYSRILTMSALLSDITGPFCVDFMVLNPDVTAEQLTEWLTMLHEKISGETMEERKITEDDMRDLNTCALTDNRAYNALFYSYYDAWNRTLEYNARGIFSINDVPEGENTWFFSTEYDAKIEARKQAALDYVAAEGYELDTYLASQFATLKEFAGARQGDVCATVTMQFMQDHFITREAFDGTFTLNNGSGDNLRDISFSVKVTDAHGVDVSEHFEIFYYDVTGDIIGYSGDDSVSISGCSLDAGKSGTVYIRYTADKTIAARGAEMYNFGAALSYDDGSGIVLHREIQPIALEIAPSPDLELHYFLQKDIYSDNPFTDKVEAARNAELALLVVNKGLGTAADYRLNNFSTEYISNETGLNLDFNLKGVSVNDGKLSNLGSDILLGDIAGQSTASAVWYFTTNVQGTFRNYQTANITRTDSLGHTSVVTQGDAFSLISSAQSHLLVRGLDADGDGRHDFLVDDDGDATGMADALYLGNGVVEHVRSTNVAALSGSLGGEQTSVTMTVRLDEGYNYIRLSDPGKGKYVLESVTVNGTRLPAGTFWQTDRVFDSNGHFEEVPRLHLLYESASEQALTFTLQYSAVEHNCPEVEALLGVEDMELTDTVTIRFSKDVETTSLTTAAFKLLRQSEQVDLSTLQWEWQDNRTAKLTNLETFTQADGLYVLEVTNAGLRDNYGNTGEGDGMRLTWSRVTESLGVKYLTGSGSRRGNEVLQSLTVEFSQAVTNFTTDALTLIRVEDGVNTIVSDLSALQITQTDTEGKVFSVTGLKSLQTEDALYLMRVDSTRLTTANGETGVDARDISWDLCRVAAKVCAVEKDVDDVTAGNVANLTFVFDHDISFVDVSKVYLTYNGVRYTGGDVSFEARKSDASRLHFTVRYAEVSASMKGSIPQGYSAFDGTWGICLDSSGVEDVYGNVGAGETTVSWVVDNTPPAELLKLTLNGEETRIIGERTVDLGLFLPERGLKVSIYNAVPTSTERGTLLWSGTADSGELHRRITLRQDGLQQLSIETEDAAGNCTVNTVSVMVDAMALAVTSDLNDTYAQAPDSTKLTFTAAVKGMSLEALTLCNSRGESLDISTLELSSTDAREWTLSGLAGLMTEDDTYTLSVNMEQLSKESSGLHGVGTYSKSLTLDSITSVEITAAELQAVAGQITGFTLTFSSDINFSELKEAGLLSQAVRLVHAATGKSYAPAESGFRYSEGALSWQGNIAVPSGTYALVADGALLTAANGSPLVNGGSAAGSVIWPSKQELLAVSGNSYAAPYAADVNGDGLPDLFIGEKTADNSGKVRLYLNDGNGHFSTYTYVQSNGADLAVSASGCQGIVIATQDLNGDGFADLVAGLADGTVQFYLGNGDGGFRSAAVLTDTEGTPVAVESRAYPTFTDWNGDGVTDLILGSGDGKLYAAAGTAGANGELRFAAAAELDGLAVSGRAAPLFTDVNGDGLADLVIGDADGRLTLFRNTGSHYAKVAEWALDGVDWTRSRLTAADLNGDGLQDLIVGGSTGDVYALFGSSAPVWSREWSINASPVATAMETMVSGREVTLHWTMAGDMTDCTLRLEIAASADFSDATVITGLTGSSYELHEMPEGAYFWRVRAVNADGTLYRWAAGESYTVDTTAPAMPQNLTAETHGSTAVLRWGAAEDASPVRYEIRYAKAENMEDAQVRTTKETLLNIANLADGVWFWQVRATDGTNTGEWSTVSTAVVNTAGAEPADTTLAVWARGLTTAEGQLSGGWTDINKSADGSDSRLCWAATAANMLAWWQRQYGDALVLTTPPPAAAEDIYATFRTNWQNVSGQESYGLTWWISGSSEDSSYTKFYANNHRADAEGGAYYATYYGADAVASLVSSVSMSGMSTEAIAAAWQSLYADGGLLSLGVYRNVTVSGKLSGGHSVTLWGFSLDAANGYLQSITISDSDDALSTPVTLNLVYNASAGHYQLMSPENMLHGYYLGDYTALQAPEGASNKPTFIRCELTSPGNGHVVSRYTITDRIGGGDTQDYYCFTAAEDGTYAIGTDITTPGGSFLLSLGTVDAAGDYVVQRSLTTGKGSTNAIEGINLRKGETAYIRISSEAAAETAYELRVAGEVPAAASITDNNTAATADALVGSTAPAAVEGWVGAGDACDFYRLQLAEASNLQLSLSGVDTAARVKVYAEQADGAQVLLSAGTATAVSGLDRTLALTAGSYYIEVAALNPDGGLGNSAYTMELKEQKGKQSTHYMLAAR